VSVLEREVFLSLEEPSCRFRWSMDIIVNDEYFPASTRNNHHKRLLSAIIDLRDGLRIAFAHHRCPSTSEHLVRSRLL